MRVRGAGGGVVASQGAQVTLTGVWVQGATGIGTGSFGAGSAMTLTDSVVSGGIPAPGTGVFGRGLDVEGGGRATLQRVRFSGNHDVAAIALGAGSLIDGQEVLVDGTEARLSDGGGGWGVAALQGGKLSLKRLRLVANREVSLLVRDTGSTADVFDLAVEMTRPRQKDLGFGWGIAVQTGGQLSLQRGRVTGSRDAGILINGTQGEVHVTIADLTVSDTLGQASDGDFGRGVDVVGAAQVHMEGIWLHKNRDHGLHLSGEGASATGGDLLIDDTQATAATGAFGRGLGLANGASARLSRVRLSGNRGAGLRLGGGSQAAFSDLLIDGTQVSGGNDLGLAIEVSDGSQLVLRSARLSDNRHIGLAAHDAGSRVRATDLLIDNTQPDLVSGYFGRGVQATDGADVALVGARVLSSRDTGMTNWKGNLHVTGVLVEGTRPRQSDGRAGVGVWCGYTQLALTSCTLVASRVHDNRAAGLVGEHARLVLDHSVVGHTAFAPADAGLDPMLQLADGVVNSTGPIEAHYSIISANGRAGILARANAVVRLDHSVVSLNLLGLVTEGVAAVENSAVLLHSNSSQNTASDLGLLAPPPPVMVEEGE